jgi:pimeloyl-ACP methyl ester carboxylesterase
MNLRPLTFAGCFGWLHQATAGSLGVVMCASWEYEAAATRRSWRVLADRLAEAGLPTLRFDYTGCGDSLGAADAPGAFEAMQASIGAACEALRERAGVDRVALVGLRLGAAMALLATEALDLEAVAMIRPVVRGKSYIAEQRALARLVQSREAPEVRRDADPGAIEVEGFRLSPESLERIARIDLLASDRPAPPRVLIACEPGSTQYELLREKLVGRGAFVTRLDLAEVAGWAPAPVPIPPPLADCDAIATWLKSAATPGTPRPAEGPCLETQTFRESAMAFGAGRALTGILCAPTRPRAECKRRLAILLNTGANSHIGAGRAAVIQARGLAERGVASLRMDIFGIGDSGWTREGPLSAIHHAERSRDVSDAIDALSTLHFDEIALVGVCSGAFLAFQTALADPRVNRILLANPQFWLPPAPESLADPLQGAYGSTSTYAWKLLSPTTWRRALVGELKLKAVLGIGREIAGRLFGRVHAKWRRRASNEGDLVALLRRLQTRGCEVQLVLSEGDPAREALLGHLPGRDFSALDGVMRIIEAEGADHAFVMRRTRQAFLEWLGEFLGAPKDARRETATRDEAA